MLIKGGETHAERGMVCQSPVAKYRKESKRKQRKENHNLVDYKCDWGTSVQSAHDRNAVASKSQDRFLSFKASAGKEGGHVLENSATELKPWIQVPCSLKGIV